MIRRIIEIDRDACTGCGICVEACHEGAIGLENGKAILLRDDYCDGLGDCLPACPAGAISFTEREAAAYDHAAVLAKKQEHPLPCGCPGTEARSIPRQSCDCYAPPHPQHIGADEGLTSIKKRLHICKRS